MQVVLENGRQKIVRDLDGMDVAGLMPDVKKIYNNALGGPYRQVETEITDPDIARYFRSYMDATGLDKVGLENK